MDSNALADLVRAVAALQPAEREVDPGLIRSLRRMIVPDRPRERPVRLQPAGTERSVGVYTPRDHIDRPENRRTGSVRARGTTPESAGDGTDTGSRQTRGADRMAAIRSVLQLITERADLSPAQQSGTVPASAGDRSFVERGMASVPVEALFPASRVRAILREMSTVPAAAGEPDLEAVVQQVATGAPIRELPRRLVSALPHAIHWLFEAGPSMLPYTRDKQQLALTAARLLGEDRTRIGDFINDPLKGVRQRGQVRWSEMRWPARFSALVVVSDLGIGEGVDEGVSSLWRPFLDEAVRRGVITVLLNPHVHDRWPEVAAEFDVSLTWDTGTGVQKLRRSKRLSRRLRSGDV